MNERPPFSDWLEKLQQESWHLELLVSGFAIFLLIQARAALSDVMIDINLHTNFSDVLASAIFVFWGILVLSCYVLIISLIIHIIARGFWIGMIGLRSVQPKVDYQRLRYTAVFDTYLKTNLSSLDRLLIRFDQISSAIFSFTFLIISMLLSVAVWFLFTTIIIHIVNAFGDRIEDGLFFKILNYAMLGLLIFHMVASVLYMLDTLLIGVFKRIRITAKVYRYLYRYVNVVSLSFLYRPIYYHLVSYIGIWQSKATITLFIVVMLFLPFVGFDQEIYYPDQDPYNKSYSYYYDDMRAEDDIIWDVAIPSSLVKGNSLPLFIRYNPNHNNSIGHLCAYTPSKKAGLTHGFELSDGDLNINRPSKIEAAPDSLLQCLSQFYQVYINDSLYEAQTYVYLAHPNREEKGIYTVLDISSVRTGYNKMRIDRKIWRESKDTIITTTMAHVPFWKE
ncbi:MAG: hypothetical protein AAGI23_14540 [Bacteroidota bacterium]